jgi:hypothetical protein
MVEIGGNGISQQGHLEGRNEEHDRQGETIAP